MEIYDIIMLVVLLGAALLAGRHELAAHPYEHDVAVPGPDCEQCEFAQVAGEGALAEHPPSSEAPPEAAPARPGAAVRLAARWSSHRPRAPPSVV